uniref:Uncharacterized protein n=1 Tax=Chloracidobacterium thermophilum TaxID=458033 RepID=A8DJT9_9BACT|nr:hypothetical protein YS_M60-F11.181 [Chloracidobacterium thermophilum]
MYTTCRRRFNNKPEAFTRKAAQWLGFPSGLHFVAVGETVNTACLPAGCTEAAP